MYSPKPQSNGFDESHARHFETAQNESDRAHRGRIYARPYKRALGMDDSVDEDEVEAHSTHGFVLPALALIVALFATSTLAMGAYLKPMVRIRQFTL